MEAKAILNNCPLSPRKMRLVADLVRGQKVERALNILQWNQKPGYALFLSKLIRSGVANWSQANAGERIEDSNLYVKTIMVDGGTTMKRLRTAPQGRGYRQRKRSNHVVVIIDSLKNKAQESEAAN
ncbi:MAG: 50S ribosomal protein L22 [Bacteroidetes bacterium]|nr:50S ribosomal protein L22 [Bacteroidota bacterium]